MEVRILSLGLTTNDGEMMSEFDTTACVVWPVKNIVIPKAHVTIVYMGDVTGVSDGLEKAVTALSELSLEAPGRVTVTGYSIFGRDNLVDVATLDSTDLFPMFEKVEASLIKNGLRNASSFPDYSPHITLGPNVEGYSKVLTASEIELDSPVIWWKDMTVAVL